MVQEKNCFLSNRNEFSEEGTFPFQFKCAKKKSAPFRYITVKNINLNNLCEEISSIIEGIEEKPLEQY